MGLKYNIFWNLIPKNISASSEISRQFRNLWINAKRFIISAISKNHCTTAAFLYLCWEIVVRGHESNHNGVSIGCNMLVFCCCVKLENLCKHSGYKHLQKHMDACGLYFFNSIRRGGGGGQRPV